MLIVTERATNRIDTHTEQTVTLTPPESTALPLEENYFHRLVLGSARFDSFDRESLTVDPARPEIGDAKP